jgi:hypothetical protein
LKRTVLILACFVLTALLIPTVFACYECGKVTGGGHTRVDWFDVRVETPAGSFGFNAMCTKKGLKGELQYVDHTTGDKLHAHELEWLDVWEVNEPNKPYPRKYAYFGGWCMVNHEGGYSFEVLIEDNGEPGVADKFYIGVYSGWFDSLVYEGGSKDLPMLVGNIQTHKPMPGI